MTATTERAILAGGCFWGVQDLMRRYPGVISTRVGYSGGDVPNATYRNHGTHAEAIEIIFDPKILSYRKLLEFLFQLHDPTTLNRQGNDVGTQYRSVIFYHSSKQKEKAEHYKAALNDSSVFNNPIVTAIEPFTNFYSAEAYHQEYYDYNPGQVYCRLVISPKIEKFEKVFKSKLKSTVKNSEMANNRD